MSRGTINLSGAVDASRDTRRLCSRKQCEANAWRRTSRVAAGTGRDGLALVVVMVCLAVVVALGGVLLKLTLLERRQVRAREWRLQAEWLVESAIERAAFRLAEAADYAGETWNVPSEYLGERAAGAVTIAVQPANARPNVRTVRVRADYLRDGIRVARRSKEIQVELKQLPSEPGT